MSTNRLILTIGIILIFLPFLGFPSSWETVFYIILGTILILLSFSVSIKKRTSRGKFLRDREGVVDQPFVDAYKESTSEEAAGDAFYDNSDISSSDIK